MTLSIHQQTKLSRDDKTRCQTVVDKYTVFVKKYGTRKQYIKSLDILLPSSPLYDFLEGRILQPSYTYTKIAELTEQEEKETINSEIGLRRTRLGARIDQVTVEVKREVLQKSDLESIYQNIIDWTNDDEARRLYEEKLLQHAFETLEVVAEPNKAPIRERVRSLANGMVIIKHPFLLAWKITFEWNDCEHLQDLDVSLLREYILFFPEDGLSKVLQGFLDSEISPFPGIEDQQQEKSAEDNTVAIAGQELLFRMTDGLEDVSTSAFANRLVAEYYLYLDEYKSAAEIARVAERQLEIEIRKSGLLLNGNSDAIKIILGTALIQYQAPLHHSEARSIFDDILLRKPTNNLALIGIGLILEEQDDYESALNFLDQALAQNNDTKIKAEAAWCRALNGDFQASLSTLESCLLELEGSDLRTKNLRAQILYRTGMCLWDIDTSRRARKDRTGAYACFLKSLQADVNFAPAYTSLGVYYADYAKDRGRARKCFQKAFELSSLEVEAAERLAEAFAKTGEWDLVEVVAQRVVDSGKTRPAPGSKKQGIGWPYAALGVVQLNTQQYAKSIVSFQSAIRIKSDDYHSWVGLGEGYHNSGRYIAATKAFEQSQKIEDSVKDKELGETWFSKYMLANVKRELGQYDEAIVDYRIVLSSRPQEFGVSIALLQCLIERAKYNIELGFFGRAIESAEEALEAATEICEWRNNAFNLWKAVGDGCSVYSHAQAYSESFPTDKVRRLLENGFDTHQYGILENLDGTGEATLKSLSSDQNSLSPLEVCCEATILAHKRTLHYCIQDHHARAVAWYNLGWAEYRASACCSSEAQLTPKGKALKFIRASVQCFKKAIELEASNSEFWNSLGVATSHLNPKVSQHSFIRSLHLNEKNARVWTNLGALYLVQHDHQLANDAFTRAQSVDPDYAQAWLGQGLLAAELNESTEARNLFTHAFEIADASTTLLRQQYAASTFDHLLSSPLASARITNLLQPLLALDQLSKITIGKTSFQHLASLFQERLGKHSDAIVNLDLVCSKLEAEYETSESAGVLLRFAQAKADLSRAQLAEKRYDMAVENAETALDLLAEEDDKKATIRQIRLSAYLTGGLANYYKGSIDRSVEMFKIALEESEGSADTVCLLSQVLWARNGEQERNLAREQLLDSAEKHVGHVGVTLLLGAIAILDEDHETIEAIHDDLQCLRTEETITPSQRSQITQVLTAIASVHRGENGRKLAQISEAASAIMLGPSQPHGWGQLAKLTQDAHVAQTAVLTALISAPPRGDLDAEDLCRAYTGTASPDDARSAIMLAPWIADGWKSLAYPDS